jgi:hypothetical protein
MPSSDVQDDYNFLANLEAVYIFTVTLVVSAYSGAEDLKPIFALYGVITTVLLYVAHYFASQEVSSTSTLCLIAIFAIFESILVVPLIYNIVTESNYG